MSTKIRVSIDGTTGKKRIEVDGVQGAACLTLTEGLERRLGGPVVRTEKADMYEVERNDAHLYQA